TPPPTSAASIDPLTILPSRTRAAATAATSAPSKCNSSPAPPRTSFGCRGGLCWRRGGYGPEGRRPSVGAKAEGRGAETLAGGEADLLRPPTSADGRRLLQRRV